MLESVRAALHITSDLYDAELAELIAAGLADLGLAGVDAAEENDPLILTAVKTYVRLRFGSPEDYDRLKRSYDEQKAQLQMATGYTDWHEE